MFFLFDPSTKAFLEVAAGYNDNECQYSVSGNALATSCIGASFPVAPGPFGFVLYACPTDGGAEAAADGGPDATGDQ